MCTKYLLCARSLSHQQRLQLKGKYERVDPQQMQNLMEGNQTLIRLLHSLPHVKSFLCFCTWATLLCFCEKLAICILLGRTGQWRGCAINQSYTHKEHLRHNTYTMNDTVRTRTRWRKWSTLPIHYKSNSCSQHSWNTLRCYIASRFKSRTNPPTCVCGPHERQI